MKKTFKKKHRAKLYGQVNLRVSVADLREAEGNPEVESRVVAQVLALIEGAVETQARELGLGDPARVSEAKRIAWLMFNPNPNAPASYTAVLLLKGMAARRSTDDLEAGMAGVIRDWARRAVIAARGSGGTPFTWLSRLVALERVGSRTR